MPSDVSKHYMGRMQTSLWSFMPMAHCAPALLSLQSPATRCVTGFFPSNLTFLGTSQLLWRRGRVLDFCAKGCGLDPRPGQARRIFLHLLQIGTIGIQWWNPEWLWHTNGSSRTLNALIDILVYDRLHSCQYSISLKLDPKCRSINFAV